MHYHDGVDGPGVPLESEGAVKKLFLGSVRAL